jgi:hypothetical protein
MTIATTPSLAAPEKKEKFLRPTRLQGPSRARVHADWCAIHIRSGSYNQSMVDGTAGGD